MGCLAADGGCGGYKPDDHNWGRGKNSGGGPQLGHAKKYIAWLSKKKGKAYVCRRRRNGNMQRGGAKTPFAFGATISSAAG